MLRNNGKTGCVTCEIYTNKYTNKIKAAAIDEEQAALDDIKRIIHGIDNAEYLQGFEDVQEALYYLEVHPVDIVFLAVEVYHVEGISIARKIQQLPSRPSVAFVTHHLKYSYEAWKINAIDYILKPFTKEDLEHAIGRVVYYRLFQEMEEQKKMEKKALYVKCFPSFDLFINGKIIEFTHGKVKELLAFLIYQQGNWCSIDQIVVYVLESHDERRGKEYYRTLMHRLKWVLEQYGIRYILETGYGKARVNPTYFDCEYYEYLKGKKELFQGTFLGAYEWAREAAAYMATQYLEKGFQTPCDSDEKKL